MVETTANPLQVKATIETWPLANAFVISRASKSEAVVVTVELERGPNTGWGECVPYPRYGEDPATTRKIVQDTVAAHPHLTRDLLATLIPAGAARNALDCALWDLEAKESSQSVASTLNLVLPHRTTTCFTISLDTPDAMATAAAQCSAPILKLKLGGNGDCARMKAVRTARPDARLVGDANEGWEPKDLLRRLQCAAQLGFETIEQPLPASNDDILSDIVSPLPICADESVHTSDDIAKLVGRYQAINIKLDKSGGLTEAHNLAVSAREHGLKIMLGCMVSTSLSMAPALHLAEFAEWVDLDGPLLLATDRLPGLKYEATTIISSTSSVWGG